MQFSLGSKPVSLTCVCTPVSDPSGNLALLVVAIEPVEGDLFAIDDKTFLSGLPAFAVADGILVVDAQDNPLFATGETIPDLTGQSGEDEKSSAAGLSIPGYEVDTTRGGPNGVRISIVTRRKEEQILPTSTSDQEQARTGTSGQDEPADPREDETSTTPRQDHTGLRRGSLSGLLDRLAGDPELFGPVADLEADGSPQSAPADGNTQQREDAEEPHSEVPDAVGGQSGANPAGDSEVRDADTIPRWRITGKSVLPLDADETAENTAPQNSDEALSEQSLDHHTRYNFDELTRILTDRIGGDRQSGKTAKSGEGRGSQDKQQSLINLGDDSLVLNRLPLGLIIFRDQEILFANRQMTEMLEYATTSDLRHAGLAAIFPPHTDTSEPIGPVSRLAGRTGTQIPVIARLQSISWQGNSAFLLTAQRDPGLNHSEADIRDFAGMLANARAEGFFEASRAGIIEAVSGRAAELFSRSPQILIGRDLSQMITSDDQASWTQFRARTDRVIGQSRPSISLSANNRTLELTIFAEGQSGVITGYFGFVRRILSQSEPARESAAAQDPTLLGRLSRGIRRPLNTIVGFSELIASEAFGSVGNRRYSEYARDIKAAGIEIKSLVDELDDFARLHDGRYSADLTDFDLADLLGNCVGRVRHQAGNARVLVRSAISEKLPKLRADQNSLTQAILNLMASAIDQTPQGGQVVLTAHQTEAGAIEIHVRDSAGRSADFADRFVLFRETTDAPGAGWRPIRSSVGLALTRSLLAVNECDLSIDPTTGTGTIFSLTLPAHLIASQ